ncbi:MAG: 50S ribosomal protein L9 [Planctomycetota bacterium]|nr:MAG: 50S ribosomal protein L9 [Planctomycetota bacterium]
MAKPVELLLLENVEGLGIVGDVVRVKPGYARNYLLPLGLATEPNEEIMRSLAQRRAEAERQAKLERARREEMVEQLAGFEITLVRSCNDQGHLYGSVTAKDIVEALAEHGFGLRVRDVRLPQALKRIDTYQVPLRLDVDLETEIKVWVVPDRELDVEAPPDLEFDNEGNLIERPAASEERAEGDEAAAASSPQEKADGEASEEAATAPA